MSIQINEILNFVRKQKFVVIATNGEGDQPEAALVEFCELDDLTIIIDTFKTSRKYKNIQTNNKVALVIGHSEPVTVQIEATARELSGDELAQAKETYFAKIPEARKWGEHEGLAYFAFKPNWVRYTDVGKQPWRVEELSL